ncbi:MAG: hypothetical protein ACSHX5_10760 [Phycisphaerales bacterium]
MPLHTPICPKCGYDQSGTIATWTTQCPLQGTCPECGYQLSWPDVVNPSRIHLPWFVEHASTKRQLLTRTLPTLWMLLIPNRYFRRVTMETPRSIKRYLLSLTLLFIMLHLFTSAALFASNFVYHYQANASINNQLPTLTPADQQQLARLLIDLNSSEYLVPIIGESLLTPLIMRGNFTEGLASATFGVSLVCLGISFMWLLLYCAFPVTRKRTKLRMVHITRAMSVAGFTPMLLIEFARLIEAIHFVAIYSNAVTQISLLTVPLMFISFLGMLIWTQWFWIAATRIGWQIKAKWWELILVTTASFLGLFISGLIMFALVPAQNAIDQLASWIGI